MIVLYFRQGCKTSRLLKNYLEDNNINHIIHDVSDPNYEISRNEAKYLLSKASKPEELVSTRTAAYKKDPLDLNELSDEQITRYVTSNPTAMGLPILVHVKHVMFGYTDEKFEEFKRITDLIEEE